MADRRTGGLVRRLNLLVPVPLATVSELAGLMRLAGRLELGQRRVARARLKVI